MANICRTTINVENNAETGEVSGEWTPLGQRMRNQDQVADVSRLVEKFKLRASKTKNIYLKSMDMHMVVIMAAAYVGTNMDPIALVTGYRRDFIRRVSIRMRAAGLWEGERVDDREWRNSDLEPPPGIFLHIQIARGKIVRVPNKHGGCEYFDAKTDEFWAEWDPRLVTPTMGQ